MKTIKTAKIFRPQQYQVNVWSGACDCAGVSENELTFVDRPMLVISRVYRSVRQRCKLCGNIPFSLDIANWRDDYRWWYVVMASDGTIGYAHVGCDFDRMDTIR